MSDKVTEKLNKTLDVAKELVDNIDEPETVLPVEQKSSEIIPLKEPLYNNDLANDYRHTRDTLKSLIDRAELTLDRLLNIADASEHPRAYEVATQLIKTIADVTKDLIDLQKSMRELNKDRDQHVGGSGNTQVNAENVQMVFTGTTADFQEMLKQAKIDNAVEQKQQDVK